MPAKPRWNRLHQLGRLNGSEIGAGSPSLPLSRQRASALTPYRDLMKKPTIRPAFLLLLAAVPVFSCAKKEECALSDGDCDGVPDDLGRAVDRDGDGKPDLWDIDSDGIADGYAVDRNDDGHPDALGHDMDDDGWVDAIDLNLDGILDETTPYGTYGSGETPVLGDGDATPAVPAGNCLTDGASHSVSYNTNSRYQTIDVARGSTNYRLITNGWGTNFRSHHIQGTGTQMRVVDFQGDVGTGASPAGYPTVYYGNYSNTGSSIGSTLPRAVTGLTSVNTGLRWSHPAASGSYNVAWDVWMSTGGQHTGYFMVWVRDPPNFQPAGDIRDERVIVPNVNGIWRLIEGNVLVNGVRLPIINYVRAEGNDTHELGFDLMDFIRDAQGRGYTLPGTEIMGVAVGFEIWEGPIQNLAIEDFCVSVQ